MKTALLSLDDPICNKSNHSTTRELGTIRLLDGHQDPSFANGTTMIPPMADCVGSIDHSVALPSAQDQDYIPVARSVTVVNQHSIQEENTGATAPAEVELVSVLDAGITNTTDDSFNTPSVQSFVTPENERANMSLLEQIQSTENKHHHCGHDRTASATQSLLHDHQSYANRNRCTWFGERGGPTTTITGEELLSRLKKQRKKATARSGIVGGLVGFLFLGPIGALGIGVGSAAMTKHRLKRREKALRHQLEGRLNHPLPVVSNSGGTFGGSRRCHR